MFCFSTPDILANWGDASCMHTQRWKPIQRPCACLIGCLRQIIRNAQTKLNREFPVSNWNILPKKNHLLINYIILIIAIRNLFCDWETCLGGGSSPLLLRLQCVSLISAQQFVDFGIFIYLSFPFWTLRNDISKGGGPSKMKSKYSKMKQPTTHRIHSNYFVSMCDNYDRHELNIVVNWMSIPLDNELLTNKLGKEGSEGLSRNEGMKQKRKKKT